MALIPVNCGRCSGFLSDRSRLADPEFGLVCLRCENEIKSTARESLSEFFRYKINFTIPHLEGYSKEYTVELEPLIHALLFTVALSVVFILFVRFIILGPLLSWHNGLYVTMHLLMIALGVLFARITSEAIKQAICLLQGKISIDDDGISLIKKGKTEKKICWKTIKTISATPFNSGIEIISRTDESLRISYLIDEYFELFQTIIERSSPTSTKEKMNRGIGGHLRFAHALISVIFPVIMSYILYLETHSLVFLIAVPLWAVFFLTYHAMIYVRTVQSLELTNNCVVYKSPLKRNVFSYDSITDVNLVIERSRTRSRFTQFTYVLYLSVKDIQNNSNMIEFEDADIEIYLRLKKIIREKVNRV